MEKEIDQIELLRNKLEVAMTHLDPTKPRIDHRQYLAGWIDSLHDMGIINDDAHEILYHEYVDGVA